MAKRVGGGFSERNEKLFRFVQLQIESAFEAQYTPFARWIFAKIPSFGVSTCRSRIGPAGFLTAR
jgi:hypothetical protein